MEEPTDAPPPAPQPESSSSNKMVLALLPIALMSVGIFYFLGRQSPSGENDGSSGFNVDEVPTDDRRVDPNYTSRFEQAAARRSSSDGALAGFVPEQNAAFAKGQAGQAGGDGGSKNDKRSRMREEAFIKKYDKLIQKEIGRYGKITARYRKKYPIVKKVDLAFGKLPRYMALRKQYGKDRNAFAFVRNAIKLPEVRKTVRKFALDPATWRATIGMTNEAMKTKPPQPIYDEGVHFMTHDNTMTKFVTDTTNFLGPRMGTIMVNGIPPGTDLTALKGIAGDIGAVPKK